MKKIQRTSEELKHVYYGLAASFVMYSKFHIEVKEIELTNQFEGWAIPNGYKPSTYFTCDSFNVGNGPMRQINLITLTEKLREFMIGSLSGMYAQYKFANLNWVCNIQKKDIGDETYLDIYEELFEEMNLANKMIGYNHFTKKHFNLWNEELTVLMKTDGELWCLVTKIAEYLFQLHLENGFLFVDGKEIQQKFQVEFQQMWST